MEHELTRKRLKKERNADDFFNYEFRIMNDELREKKEWNADIIVWIPAKIMRECLWKKMSRENTIPLTKVNTPF